MEEAQRELVRADKTYDLLLWLIVPVQYLFLTWYFFNIADVPVFTTTWWGRTLGMGLLCGVHGINVAHELGHRRSVWEQHLAKLLLLTTLYPHFFIEHNQGHHKQVATPDDPATARYNEFLYTFWFRTILFSYLHAWQIEAERLRRARKPFWSLHNEMIQFTLAEITLLALVFIVFGAAVTLGFCAAALFGVLMLETVNYIEHYGLNRKKVNTRRYENVSVIHSWNSDHVVGRMLLFELSRHSDHHAHSHKKFQELNSYTESPQMPTGYPGMMLLATVPPLWFLVMNKRVRKASMMLAHEKQY